MLQSLTPAQQSVILNCLYLQLFTLGEAPPSNHNDCCIENIRGTIQAMGYDPDAILDNEGEPIIKYPDPTYTSIYDSPTQDEFPGARAL